MKWFCKKDVHVNGIYEQGVKPICDVINSFDGAVVLHSCHGHYDWFQRKYKVPIVIFDAYIDTARKLSVVLDRACANLELKAQWRIEGYFDVDGSLKWKIRYIDVIVNSPFARRSSLDKELSTIAELFNRVCNEQSTKLDGWVL